MEYSLPWQPHRSLCLDLPPDTLVRSFVGPDGAALVNAYRAAGEALDRPLDFPALRHAVVPGDRVVLALEDDVPRAAAILAAVIERLTASGVESDKICILQTRPAVDSEQLSQFLPMEVAEAVSYSIHDPDNADELAFLTSTQDHMPVMLNRRLVEADLVVPIGCHRAPETAGYDGAAGAVCPAFSDRHTQQHFRGYHTTNSPARHLGKAQAKADEISWLLGIQFVVRVIPGDQDQISGIIAGSAAQATAAADQAYRESWEVKISRRASLVIATVTGDSSEQTWENFGRAVEAAGDAVETDGSIVICCDLREPPGPCLQQLTSGDHPTAVLSQIRRLREYDAIPAAQLARVLDRAQICLLGSLPQNLVEELGMVHLENVAEISRLARAHATCTLLASAQYATVQMDALAPATARD